MDHTNPKLAEKAIRGFSARYLAAIQKRTGGHVAREDVEQEMWAVWCDARDRYDASTGVPFLAYLNKMMAWQLDRLVRRNGDRRGIPAVSLSTPLGGDEGDFSLEDTIEDERVENPVLDMIRRENMDRVMSKLTEREAFIVRVLVEQPQEMIDACLAIDAKRDYAEACQVDAIYPRNMTFGLVCDVLGLSRRQRHLSRIAITKAAERYAR